jgi:hypothetical protein
MSNFYVETCHGNISVCVLMVVQSKHNTTEHYNSYAQIQMYLLFVPNMLVIIKYI